MKDEKNKTPAMLYPVVKSDEKVLGMPMIINPAKAFEQAKEVATAVKAVIDKRPNQVVINNKRYIEYTDWIMLGAPYGITAKVIWTKELYSKKDKDKFIGFLARSVAIKDGIEISAAEAECLIFERNWGNKAYNQRFMLRSMAQTRASAKVLSNVLRWVVVLAGYEGTPAEEIINTSLADKLPDRTYKTIKAMIKKKPKLKKEVKKFLKGVGVKKLRELDKEEGEELIQAILL